MMMDADGAHQASTLVFLTAKQTTAADARPATGDDHARAGDVPEEHEPQDQRGEAHEARVPHVRGHVEHLEHLLAGAVQELVVLLRHWAVELRVARPERALAVAEVLVRARLDLQPDELGDHDHVPAEPDERDLVQPAEVRGDVLRRDEEAAEDGARDVHEGRDEHRGGDRGGQAPRCESQLITHESQHPIDEIEFAPLSVQPHHVPADEREYHDVDGHVQRVAEEHGDVVRRQPVVPVMVLVRHNSLFQQQLRAAGVEGHPHSESDRAEDCRFAISEFLLPQLQPPEDRAEKGGCHDVEGEVEDKAIQVDQLQLRATQEQHPHLSAKSDLELIRLLLHKVRTEAIALPGQLQVPLCDRIML
eukprot:CAMPEP_0170189346 /NCGR_PEP_ID=MMETSP0040_2-20121228/46607_1 /TAXON_ID=641309 /ORGANISM="Lotharella oceanica, Strain CCMP622" /LENGTH=361 /DNA_ID=CAMNT_0010436901 /DNA_START=321 /DNA_END=1406 /DNA_ORIENTATION=+